jgi:transposase
LNKIGNKHENGRKWRGFTDKFKRSNVKLYNNGKPRCYIREYNLTPSTRESMINKYNNTGSFDVNTNRSEEEK